MPPTPCPSPWKGFTYARHVGRRWVPIVIVVFGGLLGLALAGFPSQREDPPLEVRTQEPASTSTSALVTSAPATTATTRLRPAGEVRVMVFNASDITGAATRIGARIRALGWDVESPGADRRAQDDTVIMHRPDYDDEARALAAALSLPTSSVSPLDEAVVSPGDADLAVIVGQKLAQGGN